MVVREYLVRNYGFDDSQLKTLGMGKQKNVSQGAESGSIRILVFPAGTEMPAGKPTPTGISTTVDTGQPVQVTTVTVH
jgi:hypothetical protein